MSAPATKGNLSVVSPRFALTPFEQLVVRRERNYLIKGLIPPSGLTVIWGPPKSGKSFWTFDAMMHIALGWDYRGRRVRQGPVVYCAFEGAEGYGKRAEAFRTRRLANTSEPIPFFLLAAPLNLVADERDLILAIKDTCRDPSRPVAVVLDTLNRSLHGSESSDEDMAAYIKAADAIVSAFGCAVIVVHHSGTNETRPRGHTSLTGAADAQLAVRRDDGNVVVKVEWMKDGPEGTEIVSRLEAVDVDTDEDGDPITSCVVEPVEEGAETAKSKTGKAASMPKGARIALRALQEALAESGEAAPAATANHIPLGTTVTTVERWRDYAYRRGISASGEPRARQQAFKRASEHLISAGTVSVWDPYVWPRP